MITKEECLKALDDIKMLGGINIPLESLETIENLIEEHFDNQPLQFEDLEENMWVWVKKLNGYFKINSIVDLTAENWKKYVNFGFGYIEFKEEMFYKKEINNENNK